MTHNRQSTSSRHTLTQKLTSAAAMQTSSAQLIFISSPWKGHVVSMLGLAKLLVDRDQRLSVTFLITEAPSDSKATANIDALAATHTSGRIRFIIVPCDHLSLAQLRSTPNTSFFYIFQEYHKPRVKDALLAQLAPSNSIPLAGFVLDLACSPMIHITKEFDAPSYIFCTSGAVYLGLLFHFLSLHEQNQDLADFKDSEAQLAVPSFVNPVPAKVLPPTSVDKKIGGPMFYITAAQSCREAKGILVNTFLGLESHAIDSFPDDPRNPPIYPVGPILNLEADTDALTENAQIMGWLDRQAPSSVVFLCFGSMGRFGSEQVRGIANGLERSGHRFLWSLRQPPPECANAVELPGEYATPEGALPEGFLERTGEIGRIIGWAPQIEVLSHQAVGGFVSHCGWNSILESVWCGVPIATWPMYAEQQLNAFFMTREAGLGVEISVDYYRETSPPIGADDIEKGIRCVMEQESQEREKVRCVRGKSREALAEGGSSSASLQRFIEDVLSNLK